MPDVTHIQVNAIAFPEDGAWVAQGIEYDIVAHADDLRNLPHAFVRAVVENVVIARHLGRRGLEGVKPAPARFRAMFDEALVELRPLKAEKDLEVTVRA